MRTADMPRLDAKLHRGFPHCRVAQLVRTLPAVRHLVGRGESPRELGMPVAQGTFTVQQCCASEARPGFPGPCPTPNVVQRHRN